MTRLALRGLTTRGVSFLAAAVAAGVSAFVLGERDLLRVAVLLAALPLISVAFVARSRYRLACVRQIDPDHVTVGDRARVQLRLSNLSRLPTGTFMLEDHLPYALGTRPRLVLERLGGQRSSAVAYSVRAESRGRYEVGPLQVRLTDPFGLCEVSRTFAGVATLTVAPPVVNLPTVRLAGEYLGSGESTGRSVAVHGDDDVAIREYRHGDDLRRVHWRATAHRGELMVRREERPWQSQATVILDTRRTAHQGEGPSASFEWAVSAVASIALHLRRGGFRVRLVAAGESEPAAIDIDSFEGGDAAMLEALAVVATTEPAGPGELPTLLSRLRGPGEGGLVVAVLGALAAADVEALGRLRTAGTACVALVLDGETWRTLPVPAQAGADAPTTHDGAVGALAATGWRVVDVRHGDSLVDLWPQVGTTGPGTAQRATMAETVAP